MIPRALVAAAMILAACSPAPTPLEALGSDTPFTAGTLPGRVPVVLGRVAGHVDGDTLTISIGGRLQDVRIIGADTPERGVPFYDEARLFTERAAPVGSTVFLERDREPRDTFGRSLFHVWLARPTERTRAAIAGDLLSGRLVAAGLASVLTIAPNVRYADALTALQQRARRLEHGLWANPALRTCDRSYVGACIPPPPPDLDCPDLDARGFRVRPPDPHRLDADGNGVGCE